ncbi:hypothetical protein [Maritalea myrionectae]|uniref:hypothetical protein n=1 Tax=Maritalea myrionectae TaxID=454601 RepID=UPI00146F1A1E|nr:hypothetical protein [Maritalea myrionectae]
MNIFSKLKSFLLCATPVEQIDWTHDPMSHPDIVAMSEREKGDLPQIKYCAESDSTCETK